MADDFEPGFALGGADGPDVFLEGADLDDAVVEAGAVYPRHTPLLFDGDLHTVIDEGGEEFEPNLAPESMPELAHRQSGLYNGGRPFSADGRPFSADEVMAVSLRDAHARLRPFFRHYSADGQPGDLVAAYKTPLLMTRRFMTANAKLVKGTRLPHTRIKPGLSRGPNLLPHRLTAELSPTKRLPVARRRLNFCVGSTPACRATCLLYSGQNPLADKQTPAKLSRSEALITDPAAWLRMFVAAIAWHVDWCVNPSVRTHDDLSTVFGRKPDWPKDARTKRFVPYVRPNVLSDIPFEMIFPDLFELFPRLSFYDYTKVPARTSPHGNYDLTFSFSGTKQNRRNVAFELRRERRIAVVFWLQKGLKVSDLTFMGRPVIDGDAHDFRPLDPPGSIIGLTYKVAHVDKPKPQRKAPATRMRAAPPRGTEKFVLPAYRDRQTGAIIVDGTPAQLGAQMVFEDSPPTLLTMD